VVRALESAGWDVREATNGREGLDRVGENMPDLVLLDLMMPVMHGFEFMERLRAEPSTANLPVVVLTAKELSGEEREFLQAHTDHVLRKGETSAEDLLPLVRRILADHRQECDEI
jgi:CheY-like chemotaxis protein